MRYQRKEVSLSLLGIFLFAIPLGVSFLGVCDRGIFVEEASAEEKAVFADDNSKFALELYARLKDSPGNLAFSPYSVEAAFAVLQMGARGETASQIAKTFHLPPGGEDRFILQIEEQLGRILRAGKIQVSTANALWIAKSFSVLEDFINLAKVKFHAEIRTADFMTGLEEARLAINAWVSEKTAARIPELLAPGVLKEYTKLVVVNAFSMKAAWLSPFRSDLTQEGDFSTPDKVLKRPLMFKRSKYVYGESKDVQIAELPYVGGDISLFIVLPKKKDGLPEVEKTLTSATLASLLASSSPRLLELTLPRFRVRSSFSLVEVLQSLGVKDAFSPAHADFSGIVADKSVMLSEVVHQAFVETDEAGTEAAAATAALIVPKGAVVETSPAIPFRADHPFLYFLREKTSGGILMIGRVVDPQGE